jgi:hypothetical protein
MVKVKKSLLWTPLVSALLLIQGVGLMPLRADAKQPYLRRFHTIATIASTIPLNGDLNPYGIAVVPRTIGNLVQGNILVSNFNNSSNLQGTGTTIVQITPDGQQSLFAQLNPADYSISPQSIGLTTTLIALKKGWVIVGSLPTQDGTSATASAGNIFILNSMGEVVTILSGAPIAGPWDAAVFEAGNRTSLFISCVLNGTVAGSPNVVYEGAVIRIDLNAPNDTGTNAPSEISRTVIASGFGQVTDPNALVIGPTGLAWGPGNVLYIADTLANRIAVVKHAVKRTTDAGLGDTVFQGGALNQPLGLVMSPNQNIIVANAGDGNLVEISRKGQQLFVATLNAVNGAGTLFGLAIVPGSMGVYYVDDGENSLKILH